MGKLDKMEFTGSIEEPSSYGKYYIKNYEMNGSPKGYDLEAMVSDPQANINDIISLAKYYYYKNGLIMRVINIIRDFGIGMPEINYPTKDKKVRKVIEDFNKRIDIETVLKDMMFELALTGNVSGYNRDGKRIDIYPITQVEVSPLVVNNKPILIYKNDSYNDDSFDITEEMEKKLSLAYPKEVVEGFKAGKEKIELDVNNTFFNKINSSRYEPYGVTFLLPAFDELSHKNILKEAETSTATAIIEKILRIGVGDKDHPPTTEEVTFYNNLITGKKGSLKVTVPYFIDIGWIEPETGIFGKEKFEQVDKDLLNALGVSLTLIRGEGGGNYSEGVINVAGLVKTIESIRENIPRIVNEWYKQEVVRHGVKESLSPTIKMPRVEIDDTSRIELIQWMFEHAGMPYEVLYRETGFDYTSVKLIRQQENEEKIEDTFKLREQPFQGGAEGTDPVNGGRPAKAVKKSVDTNKQPRAGNKKPSTS